MSRARILYCSGACLMALVLCFAYSRQQRIRDHTRGWHEAFENMAKGKPVPLVSQLFSQSGTPGNHWHEATRQHEDALLRLGYLTNCEFRLTNQVLTREFSSNFFRLIYQRLGTNTDQVWSCPYLKDQAGIRPTLPVKDVAVWEQTFRECAALYASNLPPVTATNLAQ